MTQLIDHISGYVDKAGKPIKLDIKVYPEGAFVRLSGTNVNPVGYDNVGQVVSPFKDIFFRDMEHYRIGKFNYIPDKIQTLTLIDAEPVSEEELQKKLDADTKAAKKREDELRAVITSEIEEILRPKLIKELTKTIYAEAEANLTPIITAKVKKDLTASKKDAMLTVTSPLD